MAPLGEHCLALPVMPHALGLAFPHFPLPFVIILWTNASRPRWEAHFRTIPIFMNSENNQNENHSCFFCFMPPQWSLRKRRKSVRLEHKGPSLGLFGPTKLAQICIIPVMPRKETKQNVKITPNHCDSPSWGYYFAWLPALGGEHYFCKPTSSTLHYKSHFLSPSGHAKSSFSHRCAPVLALLPAFVGQKYCFWLQCRAYFHFRAKKTLKIVFRFPYIPNISNQAWHFHEKFLIFLNVASCPRCGA